ncbi:Rha family transcriptional regulator [Buttiauxella sp. S19-1]|uniref:Rha family transcriptional regulator n=1 Tax=Buttiauxella sp. S19-1 TaxID=941430 RepID=UPI001EDC0DBE|nr:Rha family transcriptional regulator [Buttiauxella sp. S19-1]
MKIEDMTLAGQGIAQSESSNDFNSDGGTVAVGVDRNTLMLPEVIVVNGEPVTTSQAIARYFERDHDKVVSRIEKLDCSADFFTRNFWRVKFEHSGRYLTAYNVTKDGFTFMAMGFTGKKAAAFKENYIAQFNYMSNWMNERIETKSEMRSMADAMKGYIERTGDIQNSYAYSNECTCLNSLVLGMHPRVWAKQNGIPVRQLRDHMNTDQLALLAYLESRDCALLDLDTTTDERKAKLTKLAQRWLAKHLED